MVLAEYLLPNESGGSKSLGNTVRKPDCFNSVSIYVVFGPRRVSVVTVWAGYVCRGRCNVPLLPILASVVAPWCVTLRRSRVPLLASLSETLRTHLYCERHSRPQVKARGIWLEEPEGAEGGVCAHLSTRTKPKFKGDRESGAKGRLTRKGVCV